MKIYHARYRRTLMPLLILLFVFVGKGESHAFSLALDSVATWGRFPKFCVDTYRWGDRFFNSYDSVYVVGTGNKFNIKFKSDSWLDYYAFEFENKNRMHMVSQPCSSMGVYLTYLAVSAGYDVNVGKYFGGEDQVRKRFNFGFNCSLFAAELYFLSNDVGTRITRFGTPHHMSRVKIPFHAINTKSWGVDTYYFFNHKKYSQGAAFGYSKIQRTSAGTFFAGISIWGQNFKFDFSGLPDDMKAMIPLKWNNFKYDVYSYNYAARLGYAYNWVFAKNFLLGVSEAPILGLRHGYINDSERVKDSFALSNKLKISIIYNYRKFFTGVIGYHESGLIYDTEHTLLNMMMGFEFAIGYRFNIW